MSEEEYKTLEKVTDEMFLTLKAVVTQLQQEQANTAVLVAQLGNYINKIEREKSQPTPEKVAQDVKPNVPEEDLNRAKELTGMSGGTG